MKKRLRKKLHRGEFQEFGFSIAWQFAPALDALGCDQFFEALIGMVEAAGLPAGRKAALACFAWRSAARLRKQTVPMSRNGSASWK